MLSGLQKKSIVCFILFLFIMFSSITYADDNVTYDKKVYMVIINRLSLYDIDYMNNLKTIIDDGSIGLMNTRGVNGYKGAEGYITINASSKAYSSYDTATFFNLDKEVQSIYERRTGKSAKAYNIANIEINRLNSINNNKNYNSVIGALGDNLHNSSHKTAVFGNSDTADGFIRTNCLIGMDSNGLLDFGNIDDILTSDNSYPFGLKTDFNKMLSEIKDKKTDASFFVIETGDLNRLSYYSSNLSDDVFFEKRKIILRDIDEFIGKLMKEVIDNKSMLMVVSPNSPEDRIDNSKLSPLVIWDGGEHKGMLTSGTTRRIGIVANIDIAPTITNYINADNNFFVGHVITTAVTNDKITFINHLNNRTNMVSRLRAPYLNFYSILVIAIIILGIFAMFMKGIFINRITRTIKSLLLLILTLPLVFLLIAVFDLTNSYAFFIVSFLMTVGILIVLRFIKNNNKIITLLTITYLALVIDLLLGGNLLKYSVLSYDPIIGARYFGIGNELVGIILPAMVFLTTFYMERTKGNKFFLLLLPLTVFCVSHPNLGANVGGTISVLFASIIFLLEFLKIKIDLKKSILIGIIVLLFILVIGIIDIYINPNPTHLGRTLMEIINNGPMSIVSIILRKIQMNIKLIRSSIWSKVLLTTVLAEVFMILGCKKQITRIIQNNRFFLIGFISVLIGNIIGLLVNDSGVLLAAISNTYLLAILMYYSLEDMTEV